MSIFDSIDKQVKELDEYTIRRKKEEELLGSFLNSGVHCIGVDDVEAFGKKMEEYLAPSYSALDDYLKTQKGRPVIRWNIKGFRKNDAYGSLCLLSKLPKSPQPVVIIENITEIPIGDSNIYDDPILVEGLMLHNWKNEHSVFDDPKYGHFEIKPTEYSVLITWSAATAEKMKRLWRASDGFAWCGRWPEE